MEWWRSKQTYRIGFLILVPLLIGYLLFRARSVLLPLLLGVVIAYLINPLVILLEKRGFPRTVAILIIYLAMGIIVGMITFYGMPELIKELNRFALNIPKYIESYEKMFSGIRKNYDRFGLPDGLRQVFDERINQMQRLLVNTVRTTINGIVNMFSSLISFLIAPFFAFYILKDSQNIKKSFMSIIPRAHRTETLALFRDIDEVLSKFVRGHLIVCTIIGLTTGIGMALIGLDLAFVIGLIAGITDLVPYIGPIIGAVPIVALALLKSKATALYAILVITLIQQLESNILSPKILGDSIGIHPLLVIVVLLVGGELYGILGLLLALPVTAVARVVFKYVYLRLVG